MGALVWKVLGTGAARGAAVVAGKLVTSGWTATTGKAVEASESEGAGVAGAEAGGVCAKLAA